MNLSNQFLAASPKLDQTNFERALIYICQHDHTGAMGLVINQPTRSPVTELFEQLEIRYPSSFSQKQYLYEGGPVSPDTGFVLHTPIGNWDSVYAVGNHMGLTTSKDILEALVQGKGPEQWLITLGHAGWGAAELEAEIADDDWLVIPGNDSLLFDTPAKERWKSALATIGIHNPSQLISYAGNA